MFKNLYIYFRQRRLLLVFVMFTIVAFAIFYSLKINFVEDISKMIPSDRELERFNKASRNIKSGERLIFNFFLSDTLAEANPDTLLLFADSIISKIEKHLKNDIKDVRYKISDNTMNDIYSKFYENLPVFLEDFDYLKIDTLLQENEIEKTIKSAYKNLISPASIITKKFIKNDPLSITPIALKKLQSLQFDDNYEIYNNRIITKNHKNLLAFLSPIYSANQTTENKKLIAGIKKISAEVSEIIPGVKLEIFGSPIIALGNAERIKQDIILTVSIAMIILFLFITLFFRRLEIFFIIFMPAGFGVLVALALISAFQSEISAISLGVGSVLVGISIDYSLHIFTHFRSKKNASEIFSDITVPVLMSSFTTASAFFCLLFVSSEALRDLGLFAGISVISASIFALFVLPHFLRKPKKKFNFKKNPVEKFTSINFEKNKIAVSLLIIITFASLFLFRNSEFESDMDKMNYMSPELKEAEKNLNKIGSIALRSMYLVSTGENLETALKNNEKITNKIKSLKNQGIIKSYSSVNSILISDDLQQKRIKKWNEYWTDEKKSKLKENLIKYGKKYGFKKTAFKKFYDLLNKKFTKINSATFNSLKKVFANDLVTENKELTTVVTLLRLKQKDKEKVYKSLPENETFIILDKKYLTDKIVLILKKDFNLLVQISFAVVFVILLIYFGRIELTIITITPMIISWLWTLSIMNLLGIKFTIFNIIISTFIFGLGIDYSIFVMRGLLQEYRFAKQNIASYKTSIFLSAVTTVTAIGVLIFAKHQAIKSIALLSIIGILSVVFITYTLQIILFRFLVEQQGKKRNSVIIFKDLIFNILIFSAFSLGAIFLNILVFILNKIPFGKQKIKLFFHRRLMYISKILIYVSVHIKKIINNPFDENFEKPALIIANHQSHIDIPLILMLNPKIIVLTNDWVQNNIFYGRIVKFADFYSVSNGIEKNIENLKSKISEGYSVLIYPEGTRSNNLEIKRFHKGAFLLAEKFGLDILPIIIQGAGDCIPKGEPFLKSGQVSLNILQRINPENFGETNREKAKNIRKFMQKKYQKIREKYETPQYFRQKLISNYIYKTPVLEHYTRIKTKLENNYEIFDKIIPKRASVTDIGCGYGFLPYMLSFTSSGRKITGIDYDCKKIKTAENNISKTENLNFICADILNIEPEKSDVFILNDILHYLPEKQQKQIINICIKSLNPQGKIIIRDGNSEMQKRHKYTKLSEFFSVKLLKFNKSKFGKLYFTSKSKILSTVSEHDLNIEIIDNTKLTSNIIYIISK